MLLECTHAFFCNVKSKRRYFSSSSSSIVFCFFVWRIKTWSIVDIHTAFTFNWCNMPYYFFLHFCLPQFTSRPFWCSCGCGCYWFVAERKKQHVSMIFCALKWKIYCCCCCFFCSTTKFMLFLHFTFCFAIFQKIGYAIETENGPCLPLSQLMPMHNFKICCF